MNLSKILGILGILITAIGLLLPPIQALFPKLSPYFYYKQLRIRRIFYAIGALCAFTAALSGSSTFTWMVLISVIFFIFVGEFVLVPTKVIPPLDTPVARTTKPEGFSDDALIIGTELEGKARAYPLSLLTPHHIINDMLGVTPIAATYCPACRSGYIYNPVVRDIRLTFEAVSVRRRNMVMKDRETGSVWQHETGICLMGKLKGEELEILPSEMCNWKTWVSEHPNTTFCTRPEPYKHPSPFGHVFEKLLDRGPLHFALPGINKNDQRLGRHDFVIGIIVGGIPKAYSLKMVVERGMINDRIAGIPVRLIFEEKEDRVKAFKLSGEGSESGMEVLPVVRQWWLAWSEYHPHSELYE